jgi:hypothetical protein
LIKEAGKSIPNHLLSCHLCHPDLLCHPTPLCHPDSGGIPQPYS